MDYRGAGGWLRLAIDNAGGRAAVASVAVKGGGGDWQPLHNSWGATWEAASAPQPPLSFRVSSWGWVRDERVDGWGRWVQRGLRHLLPVRAPSVCPPNRLATSSRPQTSPLLSPIYPSFQPRSPTMAARRWRRTTW